MIGLPLHRERRPAIAIGTGLSDESSRLGRFESGYMRLLQARAPAEDESPQKGRVADSPVQRFCRDKSPSLDSA